MSKQTLIGVNITSGLYNLHPWVPRSRRHTVDHNNTSPRHWLQDGRDVCYNPSPYLTLDILLLPFGLLRAFFLPGPALISPRSHWIITFPHPPPYFYCQLCQSLSIRLSIFVSGAIYHGSIINLLSFYLRFIAVDDIIVSVLCKISI